MSNKKLLDKAISNKNTITFRYKDLHRVVEPHHYGILNNSEQIHCYQTSGESHSGAVPSWKNFKIENMTDIKINDNTFIPQQSYNPSNSKYETIIKRIDENQMKKAA